MSMSQRPARPADRHAWRDQLIGELERTSKTATGSLQPVLLKMLALVSKSKQSGSLDKQLFTDLQEAFGRYAHDLSAGGPPPVLMECMEWIDVCFMVPLAEANRDAAAGKKPAPVGPGVARKNGKDGFDSGTPSHARTLSSDSAPPADPNPPKQQRELETIKTWMMNPGLGKVKG